MKCSGPNRLFDVDQAELILRLVGFLYAQQQRVSQNSAR
jgi:hypothetical protein